MAHQWVNGVPVFRPDPVLPVRAMKTYEIRTPVATHYERITCEQAECEDFRNGWVVGFDLDGGGKQAAANALGKLCTRLGKKFTVAKVDNKAVFTFQAGQQCLNPHRVPIDRMPLYIVRDGDWRGNPTRRTRHHVNAADFTEDWQTSQDKVFSTIQRG